MLRVYQPNAAYLLVYQPLDTTRSHSQKHQTDIHRTHEATKDRNNKLDRSKSTLAFCYDWPKKKINTVP